MAIQKTIMTKSGVNGSYIKIENIQDRNDSSKKVNFDVAIYVDKATGDSSTGLALERRRLMNVVCASGAKADLYTYLKTLNDYSGATDV